MNNNIFQLIGQMRNNPQQFFGNLQGVNMNDPNAIIDYMMKNGRISQEQYNNAVKFAQQMGFKK